MSIADFISMSGYGEYVWSAYGFALAVLALNFYTALRRLRRAQKKVVFTEENQETIKFS